MVDNQEFEGFAPFPNSSQPAELGISGSLSSIRSAFQKPAEPQPGKADTDDMEKKLKAPSPEDAERIRRESIMALSQDLLKQLNPNLTTDRIKELFYGNGDILTNPLSDMQEYLGKISRDLSGCISVYNIAGFYWRHKDVSVPGRGIVLRSWENADAFRKPEEKALFFYNDNYTDQSKLKKEEVTEFKPSGKRPKGLLRSETVDLGLPDVYMGYVSDRLKVRNYGSESKKRTKFVLKGADNLIINGQFSDYESFNNFDSIYLECAGKCEIMPGAILEGKDVELKAGENIYQTGGINKANTVICKNYYKTGGTIERYSKGPKNKIDCIDGHFVESGGKTTDRLIDVDIYDSDLGAQVDQKTAVIRAEMGIEDPKKTATKTDLGQKAPPTYQERVQQEFRIKEREFDKKFPYRESNSWTEKEGGVFAAKAYTLEFDSTEQSENRHSDFIMTALELGWEIVSQVELPQESKGSGETGKKISFVLKRKL